MINSRISARVLTIAPAYKNYRGGIGAVVNAYSNYFCPFHFVATYPEAKTRFKLGSLPVYVYACCQVVLKLLLNRNIRIVHIHGAAKGSFYRKYGVFLLSKYLFKRKVIFHSHGSELKDFYQRKTGITRRMFRHCMNNVDCIICLSPQWKLFYEHCSVPNKIVILENIVEQPACPPASASLQKLPVSFLFLGLIGNRKGVFDLIEVIRVHRDALKDAAKFYIGGNGEIEKLGRLIDEYQLRDMVEFVGWADGSKKKELLNACDVYVLPSYNEGLPISILEAMSYGKPVIATRVGGIPEVVKEGRNGFLIEPGDKAALWERIDSFVQHPEQLKEMGALSLKIVKPYFAENVMEKLQALYGELLDTV
ncbi:glycosyltransferase family 4 protein [Niabella drilacis]|uniref:Glycosyltransferase involved in cell wall bisynthesis n=1 Tax=Niabella drilacis (strain DSM 25811 / CCM 8410 / CCUG 62505 / LMG 26954 / E90) TaxID=1285928 RepID=A0A1G6LNW9_NIADE|nr:glycosyltransferase family 4 protein [Niabella drilacis]SDC44406.1 Glycosyltransferase involved in cell wall bisynthesis [Niabella drilacis]